MTSELSTFEINLGSNPTGMISIVREFVAAMSERVLGDLELASQIEIAMHELLDNATRYSTDGSASVRVEMREQTGPLICIRTRNRVHDDDARRVAASFEQMRAIGDPLLFYLGLMRRNKERSGGLGLGRIVAESEMTLDMTYDGDLLEVAATHRRGAA